MAFSDPHDVLGVPDGVSLEELHIAYKKRSQELLNSNPVKIEAIKDLETAYEFLQYEYGNSDEEENEEVEDEVLEESESDEHKILYEKDVIQKARVITRDFIPVNFFRKVSRVRIVFLIISLLAVIICLPILATPIIIGALIFRKIYKKNEALYALYQEALRKAALHQRALVDLLKQSGEMTLEYYHKHLDERNEFLNSYLIEDAEIFGVKKRASQLPVKSALDVLESSAEYMMNYGVGEKSVNKVIEWAESVKDEFEKSPQYLSLASKKHNAEYELAEEIVQAATSLKEAYLHLDMLDKLLKKNILVRFWLATMMVASEDIKFLASEELYRQAVSIVLRDRKASTSHLQRILKSEYEQTAILIDRMEQEGIVSEADDIGKRKVLA